MYIGEMILYGKKPSNVKAKMGEITRAKEIRIYGTLKYGNLSKACQPLVNR
jgi:hypothetical protein